MEEWGVTIALAVGSAVLTQIVGLLVSSRVQENENRHTNATLARLEADTKELRALLQNEVQEGRAATDKLTKTMYGLRTRLACLCGKVGAEPLDEDSD